MAEGISRMEPTVAAPELDVMGARALAAIIDGVAITVLCLAVYVVLVLPVFFIQNEAVVLIFGLLSFLAYMVVAVGYYPVLEGFWGTTIGKRLCGIKVIREDNGGVPGLGAAFLRNLLRIVDGFFFYLVGYLVAKDDPKKQRLGDRVAHTLVVRR